MCLPLFFQESSFGQKISYLGFFDFHFQLQSGENNSGSKYNLFITLRNLLLFKRPPQCSGSVAMVKPCNLLKIHFMSGLS